MDINHEYVDVEDALKRIGNNMSLYKRLLQKFSGEDHLKPLEKALKTGATEEASRLIHSLKGVAANLSLKKLSTAASELEQKVIHGLDHSDTFAEIKQIYYITSDEIAKVY